MSNNYETNKDKNFTPLPDPRVEKPTVVGTKIKDRPVINHRKVEINPQVVTENRKPREFVIGDNHFFDPDIILCGPRNFTSVQEMNAYMIRQWNDTVEEDDTIFVDGDFFDFHHCDREEAYEVLDQLKGTIVLIKGNHDDHLNYFYDYGIQVIEYPIIKDGFWFISHEPMFVTEAAPYANIFAHVHLNPMYKTVSSRSFCVSAERHDYKPVLLSEIKKQVRQAAMLEANLRPGNNVEILEGNDEYKPLS